MFGCSGVSGRVCRGRQVRADRLLGTSGLNLLGFQGFRILWIGVLGFRGEGCRVQGLGFGCRVERSSIEGPGSSNYVQRRIGPGLGFRL